MRDGERRSNTFDTKAEAIAWAADLASTAGSGAPMGSTVANLLDKYAEEVSPKKRGSRWEVLRLAKIGKSKLGKIRLVDLKPAHIGTWRDDRLKEVSAASVRREWNLLAAALNLAVKEWGWLTVNPTKSVKRPDEAPPRSRRISDDELKRLYLACGYAEDSPPTTMQARVGAAVRFGIATAMRAGEMTALRWSDIHGKVARIRSGKTGARDVPLTAEAIAVLEQLKPVTEESGLVLNLPGRILDPLFRKARDRALIEDMHFHDTRAEALTRLARRVDVLTLARISGHKDLRILMQCYYRESVEDIAARLT